MHTQPPKMSEILTEMSETLLRNPYAVPSSEAAHVALLLATVAWNESVGLDNYRDGYRKVWEKLETENPALWNEFTTGDINALIGILARYKITHYPHDRRRILASGIPDGQIHVEWLNPAAPGVNSKWQMRLYGLVRAGERAKAIQLLRENGRMSRSDALNRVEQIAAELGMN